MNREQSKNQYDSICNTIYDTIEKCNNEIPLIKNSISKAQKKWPENTEGYFVTNTVLRLRLAIVDMSSLFIVILKSENKQTQNLNARLVCGQLYEFLEDVPKMFGKRYKKHYSPVSSALKLDEQIGTMMRNFNSVKLDYHSYLKDIRNNVSSHRDDDGMKQAEIIDKIEPIYIASIFLKITGWFYTDYLPYEFRMITVAQNLGYGPDLND